MQVMYKVTGEKRKDLVKIIENVTGAKAKYLGMPSAAYEIGDFTVSKEGILSFNDDIEVQGLLDAIASAGFENEAQDDENIVNDKVSESKESIAQIATEGLTVGIPRERLSDTAIENLKKIVESRTTLLKKAIGTDNLEIEVTDEKVSFPWFKETDCDSAKAYTHLVSALCEMASTIKRVNVTKKEIPNDKYAFRCFLLRLGFVGKEYKDERKVLLKNLTGSSAFRNGGANHEISE